MAKGAAIGLAMIIPGVSGGTLAVLLGVYDKIIESIGGIFKHFKQSVLFLLPILLGAFLACAATYYPLVMLALPNIPFPTIMLFAGFMLGSVPDLIFTAKGNGFKKPDVASIVIPLAVVVGICFIPTMGDVALDAGMEWYGYLLVAVMGLLASCALVIPGISGSMLLMIFGYYEPIMKLFSRILSEPALAIGLLALFAAGVVVGFFTIAKLMQFLLKKFRRATFWAIVGFVIGSIPAVIISFFHNTDYNGNLQYFCSSWQIAVGVILFIAGGIATFFLARYARKRSQPVAVEATDTSETEDKTPTENNENQE